MGYIIKVNHQDIKNKAKEVREYKNFQEKKIKSLDKDIESLKNFWEGRDYNAFYKKWITFNDKSSMIKQLMISLEDYADYLEFAANKYIEVQSRAINRANNLPKW